MMRIPCPHCGPRAESEFSWGGPAAVVRPALDCSDEDWAAYRFGRDNPRGPQRERWRHTFGCGQWFVLVRDTLTHAIDDGGAR